MKKISVLLAVFGILLTLGALAPVEVDQAVAACPNNSPCIENPLTGDGRALAPEELYGRIIRAFLGIVGIASLSVFIFAGMTFVTSQGNEEKVTKAKNTMVYAVIGIAVSLGSYVILSFVIDTLRGQLLPGGS